MTSSESMNSQVFWGIAIGVSVIFAVYSTIFSLTHGIYDVFPFLYFLPIILFVYRYPQRGVVLSLLISIVYLVLIYYFSSFNPLLVAVSTAWFVIFVTIGVVTSSFAEGMQSEEKKYRGIFENSQAGIFTFDIETRKIGELNGKCGVMLKFEPSALTGSELSRILPRQKSAMPSSRRSGSISTPMTTSSGSLRGMNRSGSSWSPLR